MSVVTFYGSNRIETAQTTSMASIATYLSLEQNYKILMINTKYNDTSLQECFWEQSKNTKPRGDLEAGINGLIKALASNKTSPEIIPNYTRTIFKQRLEILTDNNIPMEDYKKQKEYMRTIIKMANKYYDLVFVDLEGDLNDEFVQDVLGVTNLVVANTTQRIKIIREFFTSMENNEYLNKNNTIFLFGKYDKFSKYNIKNIQRMDKIKHLYGMPYNTLLFEACNEGKLADFIISYRNAKITSTQGPVIEAISSTGNVIIEKLKELQMQF